MDKLNLNANQKSAIQHKSGPLLVVAGAGTGKTRVITERISHLIQKQKVGSQNILALTFTEKASAEMTQRIGDIMPLGYEEPWVYTFHSFADRILRNEALEIGLDTSYKIISSPEQWLLLRKNIFDLDLKYFRPLGNPTKFISAIIKFVSRLQDECITEKEISTYAEHSVDDVEEKQRWHELAYIYKAYSELKIKNNYMDFGDLISWTIKLFETRPHILEKYKKQFEHILVDEFQDTNYAQYILIKMLYTKDDNSKRSLVVVGDDSQSIYKFRGAAVSNILEFMKDYPKAKMTTLTENYRSLQTILDSSYNVIQNNNPDTLEVKLGISKKLIQANEDLDNSKESKIVEAQSLTDEVEFVVNEIKSVISSNPEINFKDIAILARANNHLEPFVLGLRQAGLPYQLVGNRGLYDRDEIKDLIAFLKILINPFDGVNLYRVLTIQSLEIPYDLVGKHIAQAKFKKTFLWEVIKASEDETIKQFVEKITILQEQLHKSAPVEFLFFLVNNINYLQQFLENESVESHLCIKNLDLFAQRVKQFENDYHGENGVAPNIIELVDYLDLIVEAGENPAQAQIEDIDTINLLTVHAAKGLEYPVVFMVNLVQGRFPTKNKGDQIEIPDELIKESLPTGNEHIQEERRLFYVGMTRAKNVLYLTYSKDYGGKKETTPTGYLDETHLKTELYVAGATSEQGLFGHDTDFRKGVIKFSPPFLSYSQIDTYETCGLQYKYKYVLNIPVAPNHVFSFGNTIHATLQDFHMKKMAKDVSLEELFDIYKTKWEPLGYFDDKHRQLRFEEGKKLLERYYEQNKNEHPKHLALEKSFNVWIDGIKFLGKIDRIDQLEDGVEIIDYKTGQTKTQKEIDKDAQVTFYALAAKEALGYTPKKLTYYFVESNEKLSTTRTQKDIDEKKQEVKETIDKIKSGVFEAHPGMHCKWCDFKDICPFAYKG